eukprot:6481214-Amphidinium_carterae.1
MKTRQRAFEHPERHNACGTALEHSLLRGRSNDGCRWNMCEQARNQHAQRCVGPLKWRSNGTLQLQPRSPRPTLPHPVHLAASSGAPPPDPAAAEAAAVTDEDIDQVLAQVDSGADWDWALEWNTGRSQTLLPRRHPWGVPSRACAPFGKKFWHAHCAAQGPNPVGHVAGL